MLFNRTYLCGNMNDLIVSCYDDERQDEKNVVFVKVEE